MQHFFSLDVYIDQVLKGMELSICRGKLENYKQTQTLFIKEAKSCHHEST